MATEKAKKAFENRIKEGMFWGGPQCRLKTHLQKHRNFAQSHCPLVFVCNPSFVNNPMRLIRLPTQLPKTDIKRKKRPNSHKLTDNNCIFESPLIIRNRVFNEWYIFSYDPDQSCIWAVFSNTESYFISKLYNILAIGLLFVIWDSPRKRYLYCNGSRK